MRQKNSYSRIIQGLSYWKNESFADKIRLFQHSVESDMTSFIAVGPDKETLTENSLGTALIESGLNRDEIQLLSGMRQVPASSDDLVREVDDILEHLKTDYLDLYFLDPNTSENLTESALEQLLSQGKIHEIGFYNPDHLSQPRKNGMDGIRASLSNWNITPGSMKSLTLRSSTIENLTEMVWLHLMEIDLYSKNLEQTSKKYDLSARELALAWLLQHPGHFHPIIKGNTRALIDSAVKAQHKKIIEEDWKKFPEKLEPTK